MLENKKVNCGFDIPVHYTRLIASWTNCGFDILDPLFEDWLNSLGLDSKDVGNILEMSMLGKLECEISAKKFYKKHMHDYD